MRLRDEETSPWQPRAGAVLINSLLLLSAREVYQEHMKSFAACCRASVIASSASSVCMHERLEAALLRFSAFDADTNLLVEPSEFTSSSSAFNNIRKRSLPLSTNVNIEGCL
jgi:hypothetical protein